MFCSVNFETECATRSVLSASTVAIGLAKVVINIPREYILSGCHGTQREGYTDGGGLPCSALPMLHPAAWLDVK